MINEVTKTENVEMEAAVLGAALLSEETLYLVIEDFTPDLFDDPIHQTICNAIVRVYHTPGIKVDILTVTQELSRMGRLQEVGGSFTVSSLTNRIASSANIQVHIKILQQFSLTRKVVKVCNEGIYNANAHGTDPFELAFELVQKLEKSVNDLVINKDFDTISKIAAIFMSDLLDKKAGIFPPSILTGLTDFDEASGGFFNSDLNIIAARPGMGKTALIISMIRKMIKSLIPVGMFSLEMSSLQLLTRMASAECEIDGEDVRLGRVDDHQMNVILEKVKELGKYPFYIDQTAAIDIDRLCFKARKLKREFGIKILFIDYLQLITTKLYPNNKAQAIGYISGRLKQLAKELDIPIIALSQLSREIESRLTPNAKAEDMMPRLSDLRESGAIEQDADAVYFILRPEYYKFDKIMVGGQEINTRGRAIIRCAKGRHGKLFNAVFRFIAKFTEFKDDNDQIKLEIPAAEPGNNPSEPTNKKDDDDDDDLPF